MAWDKIFEIALLVINFMFDKVADREAAIKRFREVFLKIEARNEPSEILDEAQRQLSEIEKAN
jgi:hypothetical protein